MARSKWTLMLIPHDNERVRSVQVSSSSVRALLCGILVVVLLSASFSIGFFIKQNQHWRAQRLERVLAMARGKRLLGSLRATAQPKGSR